LWFFPVSNSAVDYVIDEMVSMGLNTIFPESSRRQDLLAYIVDRASGRGIRVVAWDQDGIKRLKTPTPAEANLFLPCREMKKDGTDIKFVYDVRLPAARAAVVQRVMQVFEVPGVSGIQFDDHLGYHLEHLSCVKQADQAELSKGLRKLVSEIYSAVKQINPNLSVEIGHHPLGWARRKFLSDWSQWTLDFRTIQAYVSTSVATELKAAASTGVQAIGLIDSDPRIVDNTRAVLDKGFGVVYFNLPPQAVRSSLATMIRRIP
jgi:hypothetical protein